MKHSIGIFAALMLVAPGVMAYQVTGPVLDVTPDAIVVQKGSEKWQIARDAGTKTTAEPKKGDKVTVMYRMTATSIEVKSAEKKDAKKKK